MFPGFVDRMRTEVAALAPQMASGASVSVHALPDRDVAVWRGGGVLAGMPTFKQMWVTRADYDEMGPSVVHKKCF
jgi:actin-related protein